MPRKTPAEWAAIFLAADKDKSGKLDENEFRQMFKKAGVDLSDDQLRSSFIYCEGPNGDKSISFDEFMKGMTKMEDLLSKLTSLFNKYDKDKSGFLSKNELKVILKATGSNYTDAQLEMIMNKMDSSRDGRISLDEFLNAMM